VAPILPPTSQRGITAANIIVHYRIDHFPLITSTTSYHSYHEKVLGYPHYCVGAYLFVGAELLSRFPPTRQLLRLAFQHFEAAPPRDNLLGPLHPLEFDARVVLNNNNNIQ
jgi:hypothetical protein